MSTLFILSHAPHANPQQIGTLELAQEGDGVLLIEDGAYAASSVTHPLQPALTAARQRGVEVRALQPDLEARGVSTDLPTVDYAGFVDMIERYERSVH